MEKRILIGYEFLTIMLPAIALIETFHFIYKYKRQDIIISPLYTKYKIIFSIYLFGVFHYTGAGTIFDVKRYGIELNMNQINWIPFSDTDIDFVAYGLNIILFVPLGFLLPLIWSDFKKYKNIVISGMLFSVLIELSQLLNKRITDIDDLILNTVGAILGAILFQLYSYITKSKLAKYESIKYKTTVINKYEAFIYVIVTFLCRFFLYDEFGMAKKIWGF